MENAFLRDQLDDLEERELAFLVVLLDWLDHHVLCRFEAAPLRDFLRAESLLPQREAGLSLQVSPLSVTLESIIILIVSHGIPDLPDQLAHLLRAQLRDIGTGGCVWSMVELNHTEEGFEWALAP